MSAERRARAEAVLALLPTGTVELGVRYLTDGVAALGGQAGAPLLGAAAVAAEIVMPILLADDWPDPTEPLPIGSGAVHADLIDDDREAFARLRASTGAVDAETLAVEAQRWRLPVTPYRRPAATPPTVATTPADPGTPVSDPAATAASARERTPAATAADHATLAPERAAVGAADVASLVGTGALDGCLVVDLSALWAGPLATRLLARAGAAVVKVDPSCRPDAFGEHPRLYEYLNGEKEVVDLDLRVAADRAAFERLVASADLIVDSFSRRVMPNLGYGEDALRSIDPSIASMSIVAFERGTPEADWLSYGPGVHATSGLAARTPDPDRPPSAGDFRAAPIAYPDALAALAAFATAAELLTRPGPAAHHEVSLAGAIAPLLPSAAPR